MMYRLAADAAMVVHFLVLVHLAVGGFAAWRRRRGIRAHLAIVA